MELFYWNAFSAIIIINTAEIYIPLMKSNFYSFCFVTHSKTDLTYLPAFSKCYSPFAVIPIRFLSLMIGLFDSLNPQLHFHQSYYYYYKFLLPHHHIISHVLTPIHIRRSNCISLLIWLRVLICVIHIWISYTCFSEQRVNLFW